MRLKIAPKLFLALLLTNTLIIGAMAGVLRWRTESDFLDYLRETEVKAISPLVEELARRYRDNQGWDGLRHNHRWWRQTLESALPNIRARTGNAQQPPLRRRPSPELWDDPPPRGGPRRFQPPGFDREAPPDDPNRRPPPLVRRPPPPAAAEDPLRLVPRLVLIDADETVVMGRQPPSDDATRLPIKVDQQLVGWLTIAPSSLPTDQLTLRFLDRQRDVAILIAGAALLISALVALLLTRTVTGPIKKLAHGARALAAGAFDSRVNLPGNDELAGLARDFNSLAKTLEQNEQARRAWIADISHELRTPLSVLRGEIEAMQDGVREATPERIASLHDEVLGLSQLVEDLYQLSLSDLGALTYRKAMIDLRALLDDVAERFRPRLAEQEIELVCDPFEGAPWMVWGDRERLAQLFTNLLENSCRYTDAGGRVELSAVRTPGWLMIDLEDSPPGVPEAALSRLFERLYRVDASRNRHQGGAGLGLSICKSIVEGHDGKVTASASRLGGLHVTVRLPMFAEDQAAMGRAR